MSEEKFRDNICFKIIDEVMSFYSCPSDCPSPSCCYLISVSMDKHDFRILTKSGKVKIERVELIKENGNKHYEMQPPCQFLTKENKCSVRDRRPSVCRMYPIFIASTTAFGVTPCNLGLIILNDYNKFAKESLGMDVPANLKNEITKANEIFNNNPEKEVTFFIPGIPLDNFILFSKYLKTPKN
jgi:Fe-S-cluster containining protein